MRIILKILAAPLMLLLTLAVAFCMFILAVTGFLSWILSGLVFVGAVVLFFSHHPAGGAAFLAIAFLVSPYGLPALAAWLAGKLDSVKYSLQAFLLS